ncbi:MAG: G1 family glutamic endopeptidase [Conexivisphaerales archaeon]
MSSGSTSVSKTAALTSFILLLFLSFTITAPLYSQTFGPRTAEANNYSLNWSGYAVVTSAGSVTSVSGSFIVPSVSCSRQTTYVALWAGIDGFNSSTVEQAGVLAQCSSGKAYYSAWYEFYPSPSVTITSVAIKPGDAVSVVVSYNSGTFTVTLTDGSQTFSKSATVSNAAMSSAECILERPAIGGSITKLANFGIANFGQDYTHIQSTCYATIAGNTSPFGSFGSMLQQITMVNNRGKILAAPSPISIDGSSFTITWYSSS